MLSPHLSYTLHLTISVSLFLQLIFQWNDVYIFGMILFDACPDGINVIRMDQKRRGLGRILYDALEEGLKEQGILNVNACIACTDQEDEHLTNDSIYFHKHLGYRLVGKFYQCGYKFHRWYDMAWMERMIGEHKENQEPIRLFPEIYINFLHWLSKSV